MICDAAVQEADCRGFANAEADVIEEEDRGKGEDGALVGEGDLDGCQSEERGCQRFGVVALEKLADVR